MNYCRADGQCFDGCKNKMLRVDDKYWEDNGFNIDTSLDEGPPTCG